MIIDIHTHTFPETIAERAIHKLSNSANIKSYLDGTFDGLYHSMKAHHVDCSVLLPVVTKPAQQAQVNAIAIEANGFSQQTGILSFGGIHPDNDNYKEILTMLAQEGIKGIKIHPVFQGVPLDDIRYLRIIEKATELGLAIMVHGGFDISSPQLDYSVPMRALSVIEQVHPDKLILAHMGGWHCWNEVSRLLTGLPVYLDTSFSLTPLRAVRKDADEALLSHQLDATWFVQMVRNHGTDHILFGSDSPWADQGEAIRLIQTCGLREPEVAQILGENAARILNL